MDAPKREVWAEGHETHDDNDRNAAGHCRQCTREYQNLRHRRIQFEKKRGLNTNVVEMINASPAAFATCNQCGEKCVNARELYTHKRSHRTFPIEAGSAIQSTLSNAWSW